MYYPRYRAVFISSLHVETAQNQSQWYYPLNELQILFLVLCFQL